MKKKIVYVLYHILNVKKGTIEELGCFSTREEAEEAKLEESFEYNDSTLEIVEELRCKSDEDDLFAEAELVGDILDEIKDGKAEVIETPVVDVVVRHDQPRHSIKTINIDDEGKPKVVISKTFDEEDDFRRIVLGRKSEPMDKTTACIILGAAAVVTTGLIIAACRK